MAWFPLLRRGLGGFFLQGFSNKPVGAQHAVPGIIKGLPQLIGSATRHHRINKISLGIFKFSGVLYTIKITSFIRR
jgi:hypothetical protein